MDIQNKINELMAQEAFAEAFKKVSSAQEVTELFAKHGIDVPADIAEELFVPEVEMDAELNEDNLDEVSGGGSFGAALGGAIGNGIYYGAGYLGGRLAGWSKSKSKEYAQSCGKFGSALGGMLGGLAIPL